MMPSVEEADVVASRRRQPLRGGCTLSLLVGPLLRRPAHDAAVPRGADELGLRGVPRHVAHGRAVVLEARDLLGGHGIPDAHLAAGAATVDEPLARGEGRREILQGMAGGGGGGGGGGGDKWVSPKLQDAVVQCGVWG